MGQFHKWSRLRNCFGMRGGNAAWPKEQDRRSFCAGLTVECLACQEEAISFGPLYERANVSC